MLPKKGQTIDGKPIDGGTTSSYLISKFQYFIQVAIVPVESFFPSSKLDRG